MRAKKTSLKTGIAALLVPAALVMLGGCGSSSSTSSSTTTSSIPPASSSASASTTSSASSTQAVESPSSATSQSLDIAANPEGQLKYEQTTLNANAGNVSIKFANMAPENHNVTIASASGAVLGATPTFKGASKTLTLNLKPGTYKFYCSVPGHRQAGMEGTLVVK